MMDALAVTMVLWFAAFPAALAVAVVAYRAAYGRIVRERRRRERAAALARAADERRAVVESWTKRKE